MNKKIKKMEDVVTIPMTNTLQQMEKNLQMIMMQICIKHI